MSDGPVQHSRDDIVDTLSDSAFGADLDAYSIDRLADIGRIVEISPGDVALTEGQLSSHLGIVLDGRLGLRTFVHGRGNITFSTVERGDIYGWTVLVAPYRTHSSVVAITPARVICLDALELRDLLEHDSDLAAQVYRQAVAALGRRIAAARLQFLDVFAPPPDVEDVAPSGELSRRLADVRKENAE